MKHLLRARTALLVAHSPFIWSALCTSAWAQPDSAETEPSPPATDAQASGVANEGPSVPPTSSASASTANTSPPPPEQRGPVHVTTSLTGYDTTATDVSSAIARDLGLSLSPDANVARARFVVEAERGKNLSITFYGSNGLELTRVVRAPESSADVSEVAALLAVNLVRDEAPQLLPLLTSIQAEPTPQPKTEEPKPAPPAAPPRTPVVATKTLPFLPANASLVFPLTIMRDVDEHALGFELGLVYSDVGAIDGAGLSGAVLRTRNPSQGVMIAGAVGIAEGSAAQSEPSVSGAQISGAVGIATGAVDGVQLSGAVNVAAGTVEGAQIAGAVNIASNLEGVHTGGAVNVAAGTVEGAQIAGALNVASGDVEGAQIAGAVNVASNLEGFQVSTLNIAKDVNGAQIGVVNIGGHVHGAQIGLINIAEEVEGASVGFVTYSKRGQTQISTWYDTTRPVNIGVRFVSGPLYALPSIGADPRNTDAFDVSFGLGARIPVQRFYFDVDGSSRMSFEAGKARENQIDLRYRVTAGFRITPWLGVFAGGGVHHYFDTNDSGTQHIKPMGSAGLDLL